MGSASLGKEPIPVQKNCANMGICFLVILFSSCLTYLGVANITSVHPSTESPLPTTSLVKTATTQATRAKPTTSMKRPTTSPGVAPTVAQSHPPPKRPEATTTNATVTGPGVAVATTSHKALQPTTGPTTFAPNATEPPPNVTVTDKTLTTVEANFTSALATSQAFNTATEITGHTGDPDPRRDETPIIAVMVALSSLLVIVFIIIVLYMLRSPSTNRKYPPLPVDKLEEDINRRMADDNKLFREEFSALPACPIQATCEAASKEENKEKNRYGYQEKNRFIAAQGPKEETVNDFWRMIWEQNTATICKCAQYWPDQGCWTYGNIRVSVEDVTVLVDYTVRKFCIQQVGLAGVQVAWPCEWVICHPKAACLSADAVRIHLPGTSGALLIWRHRIEVTSLDIHLQKIYNKILGSSSNGLEEEFKKLTSIKIQNDKMRTAICRQHEEEPVGDVTNKKPQRLVTQFHFTSWPDFGVPFTPIGMLKFLKKKKVDVYGFVSRIRAQRCQMVQTDMQYVFIYQALLEHYLYGDTELEVTSLDIHLQKIYNKILGSSSNGLEEEFKKLTSIKIQNDKMRTGNLPANMKKNRVLQIIPYEFNRVIIPVKRGEENTDYKQQQQSGNHPITVHCSAGAGRTGTFCALGTVLERVKAEGILDVFQTEQYEFCYKVVQEYIDAFSDYANFK
ncbi:hypothetical protein E2320_007350 [Naja naja]|nr:hypothetical protein E2320_007350 [Naja naja]